MAPPNLPPGRVAGPRSLIVTAAVGALTAGGLLLATPAHAAGEAVNLWLTTTNDSGGRNVVRGLQQQSPLSFASGSGSGGVTVTVDENTRYQQFTGAGASMTDTAGCLLGSSGVLSGATRNAVMTKHAARRRHPKPRPATPHRHPGSGRRARTPTYGPRGAGPVIGSRMETSWTFDPETGGPPCGVAPRRVTLTPRAQPAARSARAPTQPSPAH
ncbi:hypothetical protein KGA66_10745 [Actinocrinis puniceicyclus]|uniref:Uncharacterized protein n=1 Tax=Actinocrinis puniceicyclus TaxID=977794 RepID=A0A8J7WJN0_9ACTN|nr:hypothetical protein [Actinocrinis puniceicyclus]MBS2963526.1 hypothetical protein [Actinocrinis puniceicyclus]